MAAKLGVFNEKLKKNGTFWRFEPSNIYKDWQLQTRLIIRDLNLTEYQIVVYNIIQVEIADAFDRGLKYP